MAPYTPAYVTINIVCTAIGLTTVFFNSLAAILILRKKRHWDNSLTFVLHLCLADDLAGIIIIWNVVYNFNYHRNFFECVFRSSAICGLIFTSCFLLLGLSTDRYIKIIAPFSATKLDNSRVVKTYVGILWFLFPTVCLSVPALTWVNEVIPYRECAFFIVLKREYLLTLASFVTFALLCQCLMYGHVFYIAVSKGNLHYVLHNTHNPTSNLKTKIRAPPPRTRHVLRTTRAVLTVCGLNFLTSVPVGKIYNNFSRVLHHYKAYLWVRCSTTSGEYFITTAYR